MLCTAVGLLSSSPGKARREELPPAEPCCILCVEMGVLHCFQTERLSWSESRPCVIEVNAGRLVGKSWTCSQLSLRWEVEKRGKFWQALLANRPLG